MTQGFSSIARAGLVAAAFVFAGALANVAPLATGALALDQPSDDHNCPSGKTWDDKANKCVTKKSENDDKSLYESGRQLALAGKYDDALATFAKIKNQNDAKVLTMIGYSKRKLGDLAAGMAYYQQALALEPDNLYTHEYLGEGYVQTGQIGEAKLQLARLETLCGMTCEQYQDLAKAIAGEPDQD
jgi:tetratricopeptide (TPR) repeat protein